MKIQISSMLALAMLCQVLSAQQTFFVQSGCGVNDSEMGTTHYIFDPSNEAMRIVKSILDANVLESNFEIKSGDVENALATLDNGKRYIIYNMAFIERLSKNTGKDWAAYFVFAHEIGHHLNNHRFDLKDKIKNKEQELNADKFAGGMLFRLGATLEQAQEGVSMVCNERGSETHPPRTARLAAVASGWTKAKEHGSVDASSKPALPEQEPCAANQTGEFCVQNNSLQDSSQKTIWVTWDGKVVPVQYGEKECFTDVKAGTAAFAITTYAPGGGYYTLGGKFEYTIRIKPCESVTKVFK